LDPTIGAGYRLLYANLGVDDRGADICSVAVIADDYASAQAVGAGIASAAAEAGIQTALVDPSDDWFGTTASSVARDGSLAFSGQLAPGVRLLAGVAERNADDVDAVLADVAGMSCPLVVVVLPPVTESAATVAWARSCDATVLAASRFHTSASALASSADALRRCSDVHLVGTVLVESKPQWQSQFAAPKPARADTDLAPQGTDTLQPAADSQ